MSRLARRRRSRGTREPPCEELPWPVAVATRLLGGVDQLGATDLPEEAELWAGSRRSLGPARVARRRARIAVGRDARPGPSRGRASAAGRRRLPGPARLSDAPADCLPPRASTRPLGPRPRRGSI